MSSDDLLKWASKQPLWQQDALRRLSIAAELNEDDRESIIKNLKSSNEISVEGELVCQPVSKDDLRPVGEESPVALLSTIKDVQNVNRLAEGQKLPFALDGLTLIYGENGSGKSGYCRIAKKICRAQVLDELHPDVFSSADSGPAAATVSYKVAESEEVSEMVWEDDAPGPELLAHISVFDTANARLYVDDKNRIEYLPYEIDLLARLADFLLSAQEGLKAEADVVDNRLIASALSGYSPDTDISKAISLLEKETLLLDLPTAEDISALSEWSDEFQKELEELEQQLSRDPTVLADKSHRVKNNLQKTFDELSVLEVLLSCEAINKLEELWRASNEAAKVAAMAGQELFEGEPVPHVASEPWRKMYQYAKEYAQLADPECAHPSFGDEGLCVLCQQPLSTEASSRLQRFEEYVSGQVNRTAQETAQKLAEAVAQIKNTKLRNAEDVEELLAELKDMGSERSALADRIIKVFDQLGVFREKVFIALETGNFEGVDTADFSAIQDIESEIAKLDIDEKGYRQNASNEEEKQRLASRLAELKDRKKLSTEVQKVLGRLSDLCLFYRLHLCVQCANTTAVSRQVSVFRKALVTDDLRKRIHEEIEFFDLSHIPIVITDESKKGISNFEISLDSKKRVGSKKKIGNKDVLSEGEQRALSLSCFLADVGGQPQKYGIIIDDPVSSLDHLRLRKVAQRLVKEAAGGRQVIVFTHNLLFFSEVRAAAAGYFPDPVPVHTNLIRKSSSQGFGVVYSGDEPWEGKSVKQRVKMLRELLAGMNEPDDSEESRLQVRRFYSDLRETWERLVEELLFAKVVERYGSDVKTLSLKGVIVEDEDYRKIYWQMKRVSERSGHDMAMGKNLPPPSLDEIRNDLQVLDDYRDLVTKRSEKAQDSRRALEKAPSATIGE